MTNDELDRLEALCNAATQGPWYDHNPDDEAFMNAYAVSTSPIEPCVDTDERINDHAIIVAITLLQTPRIACTSDGRYEQNAAFIAASRTALPALITELRAARAADTAKWQAIASGVISAWTDLALFLGDEFLDSDTEEAIERMSKAMRSLHDAVTALPGAIHIEVTE